VAHDITPFTPLGCSISGSDEGGSVRGVSGTTGGFSVGARGGAGTGGSPVPESMCRRYGH
jgi:hypothetical protein